MDHYLESGMNWNRYKNIENRKVWNFWSNPNFAIEKMEFQVLGIGIRINFLKRLLYVDHYLELGMNWNRYLDQKY